MLSIQWIREAPDEVRAMLERRGTTAPVDAVLERDAERRTILTEVEHLKADRNQAGKAIGKAKDQAERESLIGTQREVAGRIDALDERLRAVEAELHALVSQFPNRLHADTPTGSGEADNQVVRSIGLPRAFDFEPKPHWEIGESLRILEIERATAMAGSRMFALRGQGARLQRALINHLLEQNEEAGYESWYLPNLVREEAMFASGQLPKFRDNLYRDAEEDYFLVPTAEVPLTSLHRDEILDGAVLPLRYTAHTPCFRREKMSAGRDVRGIKRVHQFEKVEIYQFTTPEGSASALEEMIAHAEGLLAGLGLTYRVLQLCSADIGFSAALSFDLEVWAPGAAEWLEVSSISNCLDFQARRANIRYRPEEGKSTSFVHTLNGSSFGMTRVFAAILETYQRQDGGVDIPDVLQHRMGRLMQIEAPTAAGTSA
ncbi:MAG: seryl-tRNA synthetase [Chloroflexi bacterium]|nr:MAG: seryl-tRNA synthetase [Chloroflexota bacterium]